MNEVERAKIAEIRENIAYSKRFGSLFSVNTAQTEWLLDLLASETKRAEQAEAERDDARVNADAWEGSAQAWRGRVEELREEIATRTVLLCEFRAERDQLAGEVERLKREADETDIALQVSMQRVERLSEESLECADRVRRLKEAVAGLHNPHEEISHTWIGYGDARADCRALIDSILGEPTEKPDSLAGPVAGKTDTAGKRVKLEAKVDEIVSSGLETAHGFLTLPYHEKIQLLDRLSVPRSIYCDIPEPGKFVLAFKWLCEKGKINELQQGVLAGHTHLRPGVLSDGGCKYAEGCIKEGGCERSDKACERADGGSKEESK